MSPSQTLDVADLREGSSEACVVLVNHDYVTENSPARLDTLRVGQLCYLCDTSMTAQHQRILETTVTFLDAGQSVSDNNILLLFGSSFFS